jgi:hypothetical protein
MIIGSFVKIQAAIQFEIGGSSTETFDLLIRSLKAKHPVFAIAQHGIRIAIDGDIEDIPPMQITVRGDIRSTTRKPKA